MSDPEKIKVSEGTKAAMKDALRTGEPVKMHGLRHQSMEKYHWTKADGTLSAAGKKYAEQLP
jgi:hypothetical protein